jgi:hypothetical protein
MVRKKVIGTIHSKGKSNTMRQGLCARITINIMRAHLEFFHKSFVLGAGDRVVNKTSKTLVFMLNVKCNKNGIDTLITFPYLLSFLTGNSFI